MRNEDFNDDLKVFSFIIGESCTNYFSFINFLKENNLPVRARWIYYFFGKNNWLSKSNIKEIASREYNSYGGYLDGLAYYWGRYLENSYEDMKSIEKELQDKGEQFEKNIIYKIYYERGWEYAVDCVDYDENRILEAMADEHMAEMNYRYYGQDNGSSYCEACQNSPCICSDREKTSTSNEY